MILKASQRGGAKQLGLHLLKTEENEHVELHEIRGFVSSDLIGALKEVQAISMGTKCKQFLFSVSLNPPETESVDIDVFEDAVRRIEEKNGLTGQPRVIVFHEKEGRRHAHAVWSRIDAESMTAVNMSHFKTKLRDLSRELYLENDWKMPRGLMNSAERDPRNYTLAEYQQAKRMNENALDLKGMMQECWAVSDSRAAFQHALDERGFILAKGDRRGHVAVTPEGEALSIARYVGKRAKDIAAKLGTPDDLPSVEEAKASFAQDMVMAFNRHAEEARIRHSEEAATLEESRLAMTESHGAERQHLDGAQQERWTQETKDRQERFSTGVRGLWDRLTGQHKQTQQQNEQDAYSALQRDRQQRDTLIEDQLRDRWELQTQICEERSRQAELLLELRQDRQGYREMAPEHLEPPDIQMAEREPPQPSEPEQQSNSIVPPVRDQFEQVVSPSLQIDTPTPEDRLQFLRDGQSGTSQEMDKGHELER